MKKETFAGYWNISFNLYNEDEHLDFEETKKAILTHFKDEHLKKLKSKFLDCGLILHDLKYFSPRAYNFAGDTIDLVLSINNKTIYEAFLLRNKEAIEKMMAKNKSYDGYMALTERDVDSAINKLKEKNKIDTISVSFITENYPLDSYDDFYDLFVYEQED